MMKSAFKIETAFSKAPKVEVIAQLVEKIEKEIEQNVMDLVEHEGSGTWVEEASGEEASGEDDSSSSQKLWHLFY
jgi:predicted nucleotide-binding protein (sugar kinase/HSP70/actin superfamily)